MVQQNIFVVFRHNGIQYKVILTHLDRVYYNSYKNIDYMTFRNSLKDHKAWDSINKETGLTFGLQDINIETKKRCIELTQENIDKITPEGVFRAVHKAIQAQKNFKIITDVEYLRMEKGDE